MSTGVGCHFHLQTFQESLPYEKDTYTSKKAEENKQANKQKNHKYLSRKKEKGQRNYKKENIREEKDILEIKKTILTPKFCGRFEK